MGKKSMTRDDYVVALKALNIDPPDKANKAELKTLLDEATANKAKAGKTGKITSNKKDFKGPGVEGKKDTGSVTGRDVLKILRKKGEKI